MQGLIKKTVKTRMVILLVLLATAAGAVAAGDGKRTEGPILLSHELADLAGQPVSLADFPGEVLVVNFWASWCAPCRRELPLLDGWNAAWQEAGARVIAVSIDNRARNARRYVDESGLQLTTWFDDNKGLARRLDLPAVPTTYVIDRDGDVVLRVVGSGENDLARLHAVVDALLHKADERPGA